jgi:hypothetical protein
MEAPMDRALDSARQSAEPKSLGELFQRLAYVQLPSRFVFLLQLCGPLAVQVWLAGWYRTAGWLFASCTLGVWALAQQHLASFAEAYPPATGESVPHSGFWSAVRRVAATVGTLTTLALAGEAFMQIMAVVFKCPGCAG